MILNFTSGPLLHIREVPFQDLGSSVRLLGGAVPEPGGFYLHDEHYSV